MYNLLIVDDEPIITDMLFDIFTGDTEDEFTVYTAYSGQEALKLMKNTNIDIILTDICMPGITGIDVLKQVRVQQPRCEVVFLTGYDDFDYIQTALRYDGADYVLKTEGEEAIIHAVKKAVGRIANRVRNEQLVEKAERSLQAALPVLQEAFLRELLEGRECRPEIIRQSFIELGISLDAALPVLLMTAHVDIWPGSSSLKDKMQIIYGIQSIVREYMDKSLKLVPVLYDRNKPVWFIQPAFQQDEGGKRLEDKHFWENAVFLVNGALEQVRISCSNLLAVSVSFAVSGTPVEWMRLGGEFDSLKSMLNRLMGLSNGMLLVGPDHAIDEPLTPCSGDRGRRDGRMLLKRINLLGTLLESGQRDEFNGVFSDIMGRMPLLPHDDAALRAEIYYAVALQFLSVINTWDIKHIGDCQIDVSKLISLEDKSSWNEIAAYFMRLSELIFDVKAQDPDHDKGQVVGFIKNYVEQNLGGDTSLAKIAELLGFNPSYLSRLYKQITCRNLLEYIAEVKLIRARELLKNSGLRISDIAVALGFETTSYFIRFFKKYTNMPPHEYRELLPE